MPQAGAPEQPVVEIEVPVAGPALDRQAFGTAGPRGLAPAEAAPCIH
ncbi:hypothetical protein [Streptomyces sp. NTH33]|nr:hypothetical protein [Streptomyces sp. NTH33]